MGSAADPLPTKLSKQFNVSPEQIRFVTERLETGEAVPYIAQFHAESIGGLTCHQVAEIRDSLQAEQDLASRKETVLKSIEDQKSLTDELRDNIKNADSLHHVDDYFLPFKRKKESRRTKVYPDSLRPVVEGLLAGSIHSSDLESKAKELIDEPAGLASVESVVSAIKDLLARQFSHDVEVRQLVREALRTKGILKSTEFNEVEESDSVDSSSTTKSQDPAPAESNVDPVAKSADSAEQSAANPHADADAGSDTETVNDADSTNDQDGPDSAASGSNEAKSPADSNETAAADASADTDNDSSSGDLGFSPDSASATEADTNSDSASDSTGSDQSKPTEDATSTAKKPIKLPVQATTAEQRRKQRRDARRRKREQLKSSFKNYFNFSSPLEKVASHQLQTLDRGERFRVLDVRLNIDPKPVEEKCIPILVKPDHPNHDLLSACARQSLHELILPVVEREVRRDHYEQAEEVAVRVSARNLRSLLMQPPMKRRVLAIDPGLKYGCKVVALDQHGQPLGDTTIHAIGDAERVTEGRRRMVALIDEHRLEVIAVGDGTGCRQAQTAISTMLEGELADRNICYVIVNEGGTSAYSTSSLANEELPDTDPRLRAAISIGRRFQNPLAELVKVEPALVTMGEVRNDAKTKSLLRLLHDEIIGCVTKVPIDVNSATPSLLKYVPGVDKDTAANILQCRMENGPFKRREELASVPGFQKGYDQAAAYLHVFDGENQLDATAVHPNDYAIADRLIAAAGLPVEDLKSEIEKNRSPKAIEIKSGLAATGQSETPNGQNVSESPSPEVGTWRSKLSQIDRNKLLEQLEIKSEKLDYLIDALSRPARDPRYDSPTPIFRSSITRIETLKPDMQLSGAVLNVVDFGAFVDIGIKESGLVHISQLADRYISDPREVVQVGDILRVWVVSIDQQKRRVSLTAIPPGTKRTPKGGSGGSAQRRPRRKPDHSRPPRQKGHRSEARSRPKRKPKVPDRPITDAMAEGREPMRTFGDLAQFYDKARTKQKDSTKKPKGDKDQA